MNFGCWFLDGFQSKVWTKPNSQMKFIQYSDFHVQIPRIVREEMMDFLFKILLES